MFLHILQLEFSTIPQDVKHNRNDFYEEFRFHQPEPPEAIALGEMLLISWIVLM